MYIDIHFHLKTSLCSAEKKTPCYTIHHRSWEIMVYDIITLFSGALSILKLVSQMKR